MNATASTRDDLKTEVAATAARLIAEEGADYATAKRKACELLAGGARAALPDNAQVEAELRRYLVTFVPDHQQRLGELRARALRWMRRLAQFEPHLIGAVLNGTAGEHADLHLHLFADSAKDVEMLLLDTGIDFEVEDGATGAGAPEETIRLLDRPRGATALCLVLDVHRRDAIRVAPSHRSEHPGLHPVEASGRAGIAQVERLLRDRHPEVAR